MAFGEWLGKMNAVNAADELRRQHMEMLIEQQKLDHMQAMAQRNQHALQLAQAQANQQYAASIFNSTAGIPLNPYQQPGGIGNPAYQSITTASTGIGNYVVGGGQVTSITPPLPPYQQNPHFYIALPTTPAAGDKITVRYDGVRWLEDRDCPSEIAQMKRPDEHAGFSLTELEEAQKILDECGVAA